MMIAAQREPIIKSPNYQIIKLFFIFVIVNNPYKHDKSEFQREI